MEEDKNIPEAAKKFTMDTSTDFHFDMLADPTKLKLIPPNLVDKNDISINDNNVKEENKSENSDSDSVSSVKVQDDSDVSPSLNHHRVTNTSRNWVLRLVCSHRYMIDNHFDISFLSPTYVHPRL